MRYVLALIVLSGCVSDAEIEAREIAAVERYCEKLGIERGTPKFQDCKVTLFAAPNH